MVTTLTGLRMYSFTETVLKLYSFSEVSVKLYILNPVSVVTAFSFFGYRSSFLVTAVQFQYSFSDTEQSYPGEGGCNLFVFSEFCHVRHHGWFKIITRFGFPPGPTTYQLNKFWCIFKQQT